MLVYCSAPMTALSVYDELKPKIAKDIYLAIPPEINCKYHSYVFADLNVMDKADVLVCHIPYPTVGACAELGYFYAKNPNRPIIAYKCIPHGWIEKLSSFMVDSIEMVAKILNNMYLSSIR